MTVPTGQQISWSPIFETGNAELDTQHIRLLEDGKKLKDLVAADGKWEEVRANLATLVKDCTDHFRYEEVVLLQTHFPRYEEHVAQHCRIEERLQELLLLVAQGDGTDPGHKAHVTSLELTLVDIIVRHDLDYKSHLLDLVGR